MIVCFAAAKRRMFMQSSMTETQKVMRSEFDILRLDFAEVLKRINKLHAEAVNLKDDKLVETIEQYWPQFYL